MEITKGENANLAGMEPRCPKNIKDLTNCQLLDRLVDYSHCDMTNSDSHFVDDFAEVHAEILRRLAGSPAPTPPLDVEGWKRPEDVLPDDGADVLAAIWWEHLANPEESTYGIHDCAYYEGGEGSGQKIFTDCEGEEFEAKEVAFWIYKKDLAASLLRRHIARPAPQSSRTYGDLPGAIRNMVESHEWDNKNISEQRDYALDMVDFLERELGNFRRNQALAASPAQPEKRDE